MQKVDIVIGVVGIVALIATGLGVAFYDEINNLEDWTVSEHDIALDTRTEESEAGLEREFIYPAPNNATGAMFEVTITASSDNPAQDGNVNVRLQLEGPDGSSVERTGSFPFGDGSATFTINSTGWIDVPQDFRGDTEARDGRTHDWDGAEIRLTVIVEGPNTVPLPIPGIPIPQSSYEAQVAGDVHAYQATRDLPDPGAAQ